jgi:hypothetical protein
MCQSITGKLFELNRKYPRTDSNCAALTAARRWFIRLPNREESAAGSEGRISDPNRYLCGRKRLAARFSGYPT